MYNLNFFTVLLAFTLIFLLTDSKAWSQEEIIGNSNNRDEYQTTIKESNEYPRPELRPVNKNIVTSTEQVFSDKSNFGVFLFSMGGLNDEYLRGTATAIDFWDNFISLNYKFSDDFALAFRPAFVYSTGGYNSRGDVKSGFEWRDFSVVTAFGETFQDYLPASMSYKTQFRIYLPTSDYSKDTGMIVRIRWQNDLKYYFMRYHNVRFFFKSSYYIQRTTSYADSKTGKLKTTPAWDIDWGADVTWSLSKKWALKAGFEAEEDWSNTSSVNNLDMYRKSSARFDVIGAEFKPNRTLSFSLSANLSRNFLYPDNETEYGLTLITGAALY